MLSRPAFFLSQIYHKPFLFATFLSVETKTRIAQVKLYKNFKKYSILVGDVLFQFGDPLYKSNVNLSLRETL